MLIPFLKTCVLTGATVFCEPGISYKTQHAIEWANHQVQEQHGKNLFFPNERKELIIYITPEHFHCGKDYCQGIQIDWDSKDQNYHTLMFVWHECIGDSALVHELIHYYVDQSDHHDKKLWRYPDSVKDLYTYHDLGKDRQSLEYRLQKQMVEKFCHVIRSPRGL